LIPSSVVIPQVAWNYLRLNNCLVLVINFIFVHSFKKDQDGSWVK